MTADALSSTSRMYTYLYFLHRTQFLQIANFLRLQGSLCSKDCIVTAFASKMYTCTCTNSRFNEARLRSNLTQIFSRNTLAARRAQRPCILHNLHRCRFFFMGWQPRHQTGGMQNETEHESTSAGTIKPDDKIHTRNGEKSDGTKE